MQKEQLELLISEGKSQRVIGESLGCSQATVRYWLEKHNLKTKPTGKKFTPKEGVCPGCDALVVYRRSVALCGYCRVKKFRKRQKRKVVEYLGGECYECGYKKCMRALHAHHTEPNAKDFSISRNTNKAWNTVRKELDKCILLCANCHSEEHDRLDKLNRLV